MKLDSIDTNKPQMMRIVGISEHIMADTFGTTSTTYDASTVTYDSSSQIYGGVMGEYHSHDLVPEIVAVINNKTQETGVIRL